MSNRPLITSRRGLHNNVVLISRITNFIGIALVLIGIGHDYAVAPALQPEFMEIRLCVAAIGSVALSLMFTPWGKENIKTVTFCWIFVPQAMLAYMIMETGGFSSSYARGLVFVLIAAALFPILTFCQSMIVVVGSILLYLAAASYGSHGALIVGDARGASMHITTLLLICGLARLFLERTFYTLNRYEEELKSTLEFVEKKLEELAHQKAVAVHQDKMTSLGNVIASMLNTVNHPVNYGLWAVDSALRGPSVQKAPDLVDPLIDVKKALTSIRTSMAGLRQFSTPKGMDVPHNAVDCDFLELVKSAIKLMGDELRQIVVSTNISPGLTIHCDRTAMLSVLMGLLTNATEALRISKPHRPRIAIEATVSGDYVRVDITDNGSGIEQDVLTCIFDPFFTTDKSGKKLGLGLSIAYGEIARHGGTLTANSQVGEGTTIRFELPVKGHDARLMQSAA